jgi:hypothetical protein
MNMQKIGPFTGILVTLHVADNQALYVMLDAYGTIHRMGNGAESNTELDLFIGSSTGEEFESLRSEVTPHLLQWLGSYKDPHLQGSLCRLTVGLRQDDGKELSSQWEYGTNSQGPPPEICEFVRSAVNITNPWYEQKKNGVSS